MTQRQRLRQTAGSRYALAARRLPAGPAVFCPARVRFCVFFFVCNKRDLRRSGPVRGAQLRRTQRAGTQNCRRLPPARTPPQSDVRRLQVARKVGHRSAGSGPEITQICLRICASRNLQNAETAASAETAEVARGRHLLQVDRRLRTTRGQANRRQILRKFPLQIAVRFCRFPRRWCASARKMHSANYKHFGCL